MGSDRIVVRKKELGWHSDGQMSTLNFQRGAIKNSYGEAEVGSQYLGIGHTLQCPET